MSPCDILPWKEFTLQLQHLLNSVVFTRGNGETLDADAGMLVFVQYGLDVRQQRKTLFCIGNGASASMSSHFAADIMKNAQVKTAVFTDLALLTALGNDLSFEDIYAHPLSLHVQPGDCVLAISSSGASPNILKALHTSRRLGARTVSLTAMKPDNPARQMGDLNIYFPAQSYGLAETSHATLLHQWTDALVLNRSE